MKKKWLLLLSVAVFGFNVRNAAAKNISFDDITQQMKISENEIYDECFSSRVSYTKNSLSISYSLDIKNEGHKNYCNFLSEKLPRTNFVIEYENGILKYTSFLAEVNGVSDCYTFYLLDRKWLEKLVEIMKSLDNEAIDILRYENDFYSDDFVVKYKMG